MFPGLLQIFLNLFQDAEYFGGLIFFLDFVTDVRYYGWVGEKNEQLFGVVGLEGF